MLEGARDHNLKNVTVEFPLQRLVVRDRRLGSGKSTLMQDVLYPALARHFGKATETPGAHDAPARRRLADRRGVRRPEPDRQDRALATRRATSAPSTRSASCSPTRRWRAQRGYGAGMFSFNAGDGRCPTCGGSGFEHVEMQFLSDVYLRCPDCDGRRYRAEILDVKIDRGCPAT